MLTMAISLFALPAATAQRRNATYAFIGAMPNPVGVTQEVLLHVGITCPIAWPQTGWKNLTVEVTRPDGSTQILGPMNTDTTGGTGYVYVPATTGTYYLQTHFPEQLTEVDFVRTGPAGSVMEASSSEKLALVVQQEPLEYYPASPLPTEYWTRPVDAQLREWSSITGNWLFYGRGSDAGPPSDFKPYTTGPESGHIMWAKQLVMGGLAGGEVGVHSYDHGDAYEGRWTPPVIINGVLYYNRHQADGGTRVEQEVVAVDLRTGEELWIRTLGNNERLSFGQIYFFDLFNQHSVYAYLWTIVGAYFDPLTGIWYGATWNAYDPLTGRWIYRMVDVPSGTTVYGPNGEILRYNVNVRQGWMTKWDSARVVEYTRRADLGAGYDTDPSRGSWIRQYIGTTMNATLGIEWNKTIPTGLPGAVRKVRPGIIIGSNFERGVPSADPAVMWAISLEPGHEGDLLWNETWPLPLPDVTLSIEDVSEEDGVFNVAVHETRQQYGFSVETGKEIWGPTASQWYLDRYGFASGNRWDVIAEGKLFSGSWGGILYCYDVKNGSLLWTYENEDPYSEMLWGNNWPIRISFVADGKIYLEHHEHSPVDPLPRGAPFVCIDIETGKEVFQVNLRGTEWGGTPAIADGIIAMFNSYDCRVYAIGKGPSATTVTAPDIVQPLGTPILIKGTVTDESAGAKGTPAISDEDMSEWMRYLYMQFPIPENPTGVEVSLDVIDPNGNYIHIDDVTSDMSGTFSYTWTPETEGKYTIFATFMGSKSYWPSYAETAIGVSEAPEAPPEPEKEPAYTAIDLAIIAAVVVAIVIGIVNLWALRKRK